MRTLKKAVVVGLLAAALGGCVTHLSSPYGPASGAGLSGYPNAQSRD